MKELNLSEINSVSGGLLFIPKLIIYGLAAYGSGYGMGKLGKNQNEPEPSLEEEYKVNNGSCYPTC